jgi:hypothetical protein
MYVGGKEHSRWNLLFVEIDGENKKWIDCSREEKIDLMIYLLEQCELVDRTRRCQAMRGILYLIQGKISFLESSSNRLY